MTPAADCPRRMGPTPLLSGALRHSEWRLKPSGGRLRGQYAHRRGARGATSSTTRARVQVARAARRRPGGRRAARWSRSWARAARQDDAAELPLRPRRDRRRRRPHRGRSLAAHVRRRAHRLPRPPHGLRLPVLQPDAGPDRGRERRAAAARRAASMAARRGARALAALEMVGLAERADAPARRALGRPAAARDDRPRARRTTPRSCGPTSRPATSTARTPTRSSR